MFSYRNHSIDLHRKSTDWFLYEGTLVDKGLISLLLKFKVYRTPLMTTSDVIRNHLQHTKYQQKALDK